MRCCLRRFLYVRQGLVVLYERMLIGGNEARTVFSLTPSHLPPFGRTVQRTNLVMEHSVSHSRYVPTHSDLFFSAFG
jgi:hypothetical protein